ncbi:MAG: hypothetical protein E6Q95_05635 [Chitinophagaceae bacterium]|nr:MAG: hypothetical protein E6Q95_05635 [Chitinophagaceae bacterium]
MKKVLFSAMMIATAILVSNSANAQDTGTDNHTIGITIPQFAIVDVEPSGSKAITMNFTAPTEVGLPIVAAADNASLWLNYSVIKALSTTNYKVSAKLNALIPGVDIKVTAAAATADGAGTKGTPSAQLTLTAADQSIVTAIGSVYTGDGAKGHNLTYNLSVNTYANLVANANTATVTYTIAAE